MTSKTITISVVVCILLLLSIITLLFLNLLPINGSHDFPFDVVGGTFINKDTEDSSAIIWGQSFELIIQQVTSDRYQTKIYSISIVNFAIKNINISGLTSTETFTILTKTSCKLTLNVKKGVNRSITLESIITDKSEFKILAMGDTQGFPSLYESMLLDKIVEESVFALHLGDITPSGSSESLKTFQNITLTSKIPCTSMACRELR